MNDNIPNEIITNIATYLSQQDLYACICVCRSWNTALTPALYNSVNIQSQEQLEQFIDALRRTERRNPLGHFVRKIYGPVEIRHDQLVFLPRLCPYVTEFMIWKGWSLESTEAVQEWKHLARISSVTIENGPPKYSLDFFGKRIRQLDLHIHGYPEWINLMAELPCLESLTIYGSARNNGDEDTRITLSGLETALSALPHLNWLGIYNSLLCGEMPVHIAPCDTVRYLYLSCDDSLLWGQYFAQKYTSIEHLKISSVSEATYEIHQAKTLVRACRSLKLFRTQYSQGYPGSMYRECLEVLSEIGAPLTCLTFRHWDYPSYATIVSSFHATASDIDFHTEDKMTDKEILDPLKSFQNLERLNVVCPRVDFRVDYCLNICKNLKNLEIEGNVIGITNDSTMDYQRQHGLKSLLMTGEDIADKTYPYLLQHCPRLYDLRCYYNESCTRSCEIYFPSPSLHNLHASYCNNVLFKVMGSDKTEQSPEVGRIYHASIDEQKSHGQEQWYLQQGSEDNRSYRQLNDLEINQITGQLCKNNNASGIEESKQSDESQKLSSNPCEYPTVAITSYFINQENVWFDYRGLDITNSPL